MKNYADYIASSMNSILNDPEHKNIFSSSAVLEKLAFTRVADEEKPTEIENELAVILDEEQLSVTASNPRADCVACMKTRQGWNENMGLCTCTREGCSVMDGCKENCSCGCKVKKAGVSMSDMLVKSAFDALLKASSDLEEAGFGKLSAHTIILMNDLVVEAKAKKNKKDDKKDKEKERAKLEKERAKQKADKEKSKAKAEKDKNDARDKAMKEKIKLEKEKAAAKEKAEKDKKKAKK